MEACICRGSSVHYNTTVKPDQINFWMSLEQKQKHKMHLMPH